MEMQNPIATMRTLCHFAGYDAAGEQGGVSGRGVGFHIPLYQRMYVWGQSQIHQMLADIEDARRAGRDEYFLGTVVGVKKQPADGAPPRLELIDGQQRLTTLWMIALACYQYRRQLGYEDQVGEKLRAFLAWSWGDRSEGNYELIPRLHFEIRERASRWTQRRLMQALSRSGQASSSTVDALEEEDEGERLTNLENALDFIKDYIWEVRGSAHRYDVEDTPDFDTFLMDHLKLLAIEVPSSMDLNHLFEVINDRSVQLEHHEVLKARMFSRLHGGSCGQHGNGQEGERLAYGRLWDACADMDDYLESALPRKTQEVTKAGLLSKLMTGFSGSVGGTQLPQAGLSPTGDQIVELSLDGKDFPSESEIGDFSLEDLIRDVTQEAQERAPETQGRGADEGERDQPEVRSIIPFPVLLQHTLRIWLYYHGPRNDQGQTPDLPNIDDRSLLEYFEVYFFDAAPDGYAHVLGESERVRSFLKLLWEVRWVFDLYVIKWGLPNGEDQWLHVLRRLEAYKSGDNSPSLSRAELDQSQDYSLLLLQSLLYHTQNPRQQLWLTPFLGYLHRLVYGYPAGTTEPESSSLCHPSSPELSDVEAFLRRLDDGLYCASPTERMSGSLAERTRRFLENPERDHGGFDLEPLERRFQDEYGGIPHYWFYKIDYILWLETTAWLNAGNDVIREDVSSMPTEAVDKAWKTFRMTARSSVEHIVPQKEDASGQPNDEWQGDEKDRLGNLALVSRNRNSEFGNRSFGQKQHQFLDRLRIHDLLSPKLAWVYLYGGSPWVEDAAEKADSIWTPEAARHHERAVLDAVRRYFGMQ